MFLYILFSKAHFHLTGHTLFNSPLQTSPFIRENKDFSQGSLFNSPYDESPLPNTLTNSFSSNGTADSSPSPPQPSSLLHYHLKPSIVIRRIPIFFSSLDENSLDEESSPESSESKKSSDSKPSFFMKLKETLLSFYQSITIFRFLCFAIIAVLFTLVGYHIRKREERSNYVRLPNEA